MIDVWTDEEYEQCMRAARDYFEQRDLEESESDQQEESE